MYKKKQHLLTILLSIGLSTCMTASSVVYASDTRTVPAEVPALEGEMEEEAETESIESFAEEALPTPTEEVSQEEAAASIPEEADMEEAVSQIQGQEENTGLGFETRGLTININNADSLIFYADGINNGNLPADTNIVLMADINMAGKNWTPIGQGNVSYKGTFDGKQHTILNVTCSTPAQFAGIFGETEGAVIRNLGVTGSFSNPGCVGGIVGYARNTTIENCWNGASISGGSVGGIAGSSGTSGSSVIKNCYNYGRITGSDCGGGIVGILGEYSSVSNCMSYTESERQIVGDISRGYPSAQNSYYLSTSQGASAYGTPAAKAQFASGEIAWLLNGKLASGIWKQNVGTDAYPTFTGGIVQPAPAPDFIYASSSNSITVDQGSLAEYKYGTALYKIDDQEWTNNPSFGNLKADTTYHIRVKYLGTGNYLPSEEAQDAITTEPAAYLITIPTSAAAGGSAKEIEVSKQQPFSLGYEGQVNVKITGGMTAGKASLTREHDAGQATIASELFVDHQKFEHLSQNVATFRKKNDKAVSIAFKKPEGTVPAGTYRGTVTFEIVYTQ